MPSHSPTTPFQKNNSSQQGSFLFPLLNPRWLHYHVELNLFFFLSFFISIYERVHIPNPPKKISTPPQKGNPKPIRFHHFSVSTRRSGSTTSEMPGNGVGWSNPTKLLLLWGNPPLNGVIWGYNPLTLNLAFLKYIEIGINVEEWDRNDHKLKVSIFSDLHFFFWAWITDILNEGPPPPKWWLQ